MCCATRANSVSSEFARKGFLQYKTDDVLRSRANSVPSELQEGMGGRSRCFAECCAARANSVLQNSRFRPGSCFRIGGKSSRYCELCRSYQFDTEVSGYTTRALPKRASVMNAIVLTILLKYCYIYIGRRKGRG